MIMIVGSQHDDILYFESVITNKREETVLGKFKVSLYFLVKLFPFNYH